MGQTGILGIHKPSTLEAVGYEYADNIFSLNFKNTFFYPFKSTSLESDTNDTLLFTRMIYVVQQGWGGGGFPRTSGNCEEYYRVVIFMTFPVLLCLHFRECMLSIKRVH
jgi:hypothetical protein